jgi:hypothetical protein
MAGGDGDGIYAASVPQATGQGDLLACRECGLLKTAMQVRPTDTSVFLKHPDLMLYA